MIVIMTPEEYERIKESEKQHLIAIKKLKDKLRQVERQNSINKAMNEIAGAPGEDILNTHEEMVDKLAMDAVHQEARLEIALSAQKEQEEQLEEMSPSPEENDAELQKIRAQELVRQMKIQMGLEHVKRKQESSQDVREDKQAEDSPEGGQSGSAKPSDSLPDKTIGRMSGESS